MEFFDEDFETERVGFKGFKNEKNDYSKPINFVPSKTSKPTENVEIIEEDEKEKEDEIIEIVDLSQTEIKPHKPMSNQDFRYLFDQQEEIPSKTFEVIESKKKEDKKRKEKEEEKSEEPKKKREKGFASFLDQKVGKNVLNMMLKMGYKYDKGLGRNEEGIINPIRLKKDEKGRGEWITDFEKKEDEEIKEEIPKPDFSWKKGKKKTKKPKSAQEYIETHPTQPIVDEIIDMTGKETKIRKVKQINQNTFSKILPELQYNISQLVIISENKIEEIDQNMKLQKDKFEMLKFDQLRLSQKIDQKKKEKQDIEYIHGLINQIKLMINTTSPNFEEIVIKIQLITSREIYQKMNLSKSIISLLYPLLSRIYLEWNPSKTPKYKINEIKKLKEILTVETDYEILIQEIIYPKARQFIQEWNVRQPFPALEFIEYWNVLLPERILSNLQNMIIQKMKIEIDNWNPTSELIHSWIHPWVIFLSNQMESSGILDSIRAKISSLLNEWNPSDLSAHEYLKIWKNIFKESDMFKILSRNIVPKLVTLLREDFKINPSNQNIEPFQWFILWNDIIPEPLMITIFEQEFFPKWRNVLYKWLNSNPQFEEILIWYNGWKSIFPENIGQNSRIQSLFNKGLDMINQALSNEEITNEEKEKDLNVKKLETKNLSFKELIENYAAQSDILFIPKNQMYQGKPLYSFGNVTIYLENECIFVKEKDKFLPKSLQELLNMIK